MVSTVPGTSADAHKLSAWTLSGVDGADAVPGEDTALLCSQHFQDYEMSRLMCALPTRGCRETQVFFLIAAY